jgi:hypothetical protein
LASSGTKVILGAAVIGHEPVLTTVGAGLTVTDRLLQVLRDRQEKPHEIRMQPFFFLYGVNAALSRRR